MNRVILMGRLTRDPEVRYSQGERSMAIARYTLAVDRRGRRGQDSSAEQQQPILSTVLHLTALPSSPRSISVRECGCLCQAESRQVAM